MSKKIRALVISITAELVEELLKKYVKNIPEDLRVDSVDYGWVNRKLDFCFTSEEFPIVKDGIKRNAAVGMVSVYTNADKTTTATLKWKDPNKKKED